MRDVTSTTTILKEYSVEVVTSPSISVTVNVGVVHLPGRHAKVIQFQVEPSVEINDQSMIFEPALQELQKCSLQMEQ